MTRLLAWILGLWLLVTITAMVVKAVALALAALVVVAALAALHRIRPMACCAICVVGIATFVPKVVWPWAAVTLLVWGAMEGARAVFLRVRRPKQQKLPLA